MQTQKAQLTDVGRVREENQDSCGSFRSPWGQVFVVADGMGGAAGGKMASQMAVDAVQDVLTRETGDPPALLVWAIEEANRRIHAKGSTDDPRFKRMGTTVVAALVRDDLVYLAHVGDSRAYIFRQGNLHRLTKDHSQVQQLVDLGMLTSQEAEQHPDSNILTRALGQKPTVEVDLRREPIRVLDGDLMLLCSDGLWGLVSDIEMQRLVASGGEVEDICRRLLKLALDAGGSDNVAIQVVAFLGDGELPRTRRRTPAMPGTLHSRGMS